MNTAVIFAGGVGRRMNSHSLPKQFLKMHGKEIIIYTLENFEQHPMIDGIVIACVEEWIGYLQDIVRKNGLKKVLKIVPGGKTGQESIYAGLKAAQAAGDPEKDIVLLHDGVRPLIDAATITSCIESVESKGSAVTTAPANETIIRIEKDGHIKDVIERAQCLLARAPQCFYLKDILDAHEKARSEHKTDFIDSATLMKYYGHSLSVVEGPAENIKITTPADYYSFRALFEARENAQLFGGD